MDMVSMPGTPARNALLVSYLLTGRLSVLKVNRRCVRQPVRMTGNGQR